MCGFALLDHQLYRVLNVLRERWFTKENLVDMLQLPADQLEETLERLKEIELVQEIVLENKSFLLLISDFKVRSFTPEYMINQIVSRWNAGRIEKDLALEHLKILQEQFI